jgi:hypothetical protein
MRLARQVSGIEKPFNLTTGSNPKSPQAVIVKSDRPCGFFLAKNCCLFKQKK